MKTIIKQLPNLGATLLLFFLATSNAMGATMCGPGGTQGIPNPISACNFFDFIQQLLNTVAKLGAVIVAFCIIYSGFLFVTAQGNEEKLKKAKMALTYTLIGAAVALGSAVIATIIANTINSLK